MFSRTTAVLISTPVRTPHTVFYAAFNRTTTTLLEAEGGHQRHSCRFLLAPSALCLAEPSCTPSHPPLQETPNNIGNKNYSAPNTGSHSNIGRMSSAPKTVTN